MSEKALQEFSAKIVKAKNLYETTKTQCEILKREAVKLEKEYQMVANQRKEAEQLELTLKNHFEETKRTNKSETDKCAKEIEELNALRNLKKKLKRDKDIYESELMKNSLTLEELVKERINLQNIAKGYSEKLESVTAERQALQEEYVKTNAAIEEYSSKIKELKEEMDTMKGLISQSVLTVGNIQGQGQGQSPDRQHISNINASKNQD